jgi:hypothetical protein
MFYDKLNQKRSAEITGKLSEKLGIGLFSLSKEEKLTVSSKGGNKQLRRAIFDPEVRKRHYDTLKRKKISAYYDDKLRKEISSKGGQNGFF